MVMTDDLVASVASKDCFSLGTPKNQVEDTPKFFIGLREAYIIRIMHVRASRLHLC